MIFILILITLVFTLMDMCIKDSNSHTDQEIKCSYDVGDSVTIKSKQWYDKNKNFTRKIKVYLENDENSSKFDIATINIDIGQEEELFKIAFRPGKSAYRYLIFENIASNDAIFQFKPKTIMQLSNIFDNINIVQFGLQADPGFIFLINGEPMRVGRTGFFESPEGYEISNVGVTEPNFIIDYTHKVVKGVN